MNTRITDRWGGVATVLAALLPLLSGCGGGSTETAEPPPPPPIPYVYAAPADNGDLWQVAEASETGMTEALLEDMVNALRAGEFPIVDSVAISHAGRLVLHETIRTELNPFDEWVDNTDPALHVQFSVSKSLVSSLVGVAIDQGVFESVDTPYLSLFDYEAYDNWDERKNDMTLADVMKMRLGLEWNEWDPAYTDPANQLLTFYDTQTDYSKALLDLPMAAEPGSTFAYNTVASVSLGQAIENRAPLSLIDYGGAFLLAPLGISNIEVFRTPTGLPDLGRGLFLTTRDMLKFGQLYMDNGLWNGERLLSSDWISESLTPYTSIRWAGDEPMEWEIDGYGYQWWLGHFDIDGRQLDTFAAWGHGEQWIMAIPALQVVIAINSHAWEGGPAETNQVFNLIRRFIIPAVEG